MWSRPLKPLVTAFSHSTAMSIAAYNEAFNFSGAANPFSPPKPPSCIDLFE
jgi:hypothetical protein